MKDEIILVNNKKCVYTINKNHAWNVFLLLFSPPILMMIFQLHKYFYIYQLIIFYIIYLIIILFFAWKILVKKYPQTHAYIA